MPLAQQAVAGVEAGKAKMKEEAEKYVGEVQKGLDDLKKDVAEAIKKLLFQGKKSRLLSGNGKLILPAARINSRAARFARPSMS